MFNPLSIRQQFPFFQQQQQGIYFDNAATTQKPELVIQSMLDFYQYANANVHRSSHVLGQQASSSFEAARKKVAEFIHANSEKEIIWTKGCTESINLLGHVLSQHYLQPGQEILISALEHHANLVPWQQIAKHKGLQLRVIPVTAQGILDLQTGLEMITDNTALLAIGHVSNALGNINPIQPLIEKAKQHQALTFVDGAQAVAHLEVDVQQLDCDFYAFSAHKMFGPTGIGVLYGKQKLLEELPPYQFGGEMVQHVSFARTEVQALPFKFEAGTPNIQGVLGLAAAVDFLQALERQQVTEYEDHLYQLLLQGLQDIEGIKVWGDKQQSISTVAFTYTGLAIQDLAILLSEQGVAIRAGHHCAMPLMQALEISGTLRASLCCYNTEQEVLHFLQLLKLCINKLTDKTAELDNFQEQATQANETALPLAQKIKQARGWDETYRQIMLAGKNLNRLAACDKTAETEVFGCESQVWVKCANNHSGVVIQADSNSKIVRGLLALMLEPLQQQNIAQIQAFDVHQYMRQLELDKHLSESRGNGLNSVLTSIKTFIEKI